MPHTKFIHFSITRTKQAQGIYINMRNMNTPGKYVGWSEHCPPQSSSWRRPWTNVPFPCDMSTGTEWRLCSPTGPRVHFC